MSDSKNGQGAGGSRPAGSSDSNKSKGREGDRSSDQKSRAPSGSGGNPPVKRAAVGSSAFTWRVLLGMLCGVVAGLLLPYVIPSVAARTWIQVHIFVLGGDVFIRLLKMLVVPIVFVSLVSGVSSLGDLRQLGRIGGKSLLCYTLTTALAIALALALATMIPVGSHMQLAGSADYVPPVAPSVKSLLLSIVPINPVQALAQGNMLQIILFAVLFGVAITSVQQLRHPRVAASGVSIQGFFKSLNDVLMRMITMIMNVAPIGVFFLLAGLMEQGAGVLAGSLGYFFLVLFVLLVQWAGVYTLLLMLLARLNPFVFMRKMYPAMMFAFSVSSSNASIPIVLKTVQERLGVANSVAAFVIPLGATINMDGTAIMQGVATMFISHACHVPLGFVGYLTVISMATIASIGTAGVPSVGLITLAMVLERVNLPVEGIALIIGIDRLLDMARTAVNISGDAMVSCIVAKSEKLLDHNVYTGK